MSTQSKRRYDEVKVGSSDDKVDNDTDDYESDDEGLHRKWRYAEVNVGNSYDEVGNDIDDYEGYGDGYYDDSDEGAYKTDIEKDKDDDASEDEDEDITDRLQRYLCYQCNDTYILEYIQKKPTSVRKLNRINECPLHIACAKEHPENLVMKLSELFPMAAHQLGWKGYPLHLACGNGQSEAVVMNLIELFPDAAWQGDMTGESPLHLACSSGQPETVVMKLIELCPFAAQQLNRSSYYPLYSALSGRQSVNVVMKLIEIFPDAAFKPVEGGDYALHMACERNLPEAVIQKLVEMNPASLDEKTGDFLGWYPFHSAIGSCRRTKLEHVHPSMAIIRLIMEADPRANEKQTSKGESLLHVAYSLRHYDLAEFILQQSNVLVNIKDKDMMTTLHRACGGCNYDAIEKLLQHPDIDINARDKKGETPLHNAVISCHSSTIQQLLDQPLIDINPTNNRNKTPLDVVEEKIHKSRNQHANLNAQRQISVKNLLKKEKLERRLQFLMNIKNLFVEYPVKRRWISYQYYLNSQLDL